MILIQTKLTRNLFGNRRAYCNDLLVGLGNYEKQKTLLQNVGKFIDLTFPFPVDYAPKGFEEQVYVKNMRILLTEQRASILIESANSVAQKPNFKNGLVLAGPHGIGKSTEALLVAIYAHANKYPLFYVPRAAQFIIHKEKYFFTTMRELNQESLSSHLMDKLNEYSTKRDLQSAMFDFMSELNNGEQPMFYIIDEHNEFYKRTMRVISEEKVYLDVYPKDNPVLEQFTKWTGATAGKNTFTLYAGSAHSKFLSRMPAGESPRIRHIRAFSDEEFETAVSDERSPFYFEHHSDERQLTQLKHKVGKIPRFLKELKDLFDGDIDRYVQYNRSDMYDQLKKWFKEKQENRESIEAEEFLEKAAFGIYNAPQYGRSDAIDPGLVYFDKEGTMTVVNDTASKLITQKWAETVNILPLEKEDEANRGTNFEMQIRRSFLKGKDISLKCFNILGTTTQFHLPLNGCNLAPAFASKSGEKFNFDGMKNYPDFIESKLGPVFWIPGFIQFPYLDFVLDTGLMNSIRRIYVFQTTIQSATNHKDSALKFFESKEEFVKRKKSEFSKRKDNESKEPFDEVSVKNLFECQCNEENLRRIMRMKASDELFYIYLTNSSDKSMKFKGISRRNSKIFVATQEQTCASFHIF